MTYGNVEESILRDRIVVGVHDDSTRRKLLQKRNLDLNNAIVIRKASELASKQLRAMTSPEEVNALKSPYNRSSSRSRDKQRQQDQRRNEVKRDQSNGKRCNYCNRLHAPSKQACPAYGKVCSRCSKPNHFQAVMCVKLY